VLDNRKILKLNKLQREEFFYACLLEEKVYIEKRKINTKFEDYEVIVKIERMGICRADVKEVSDRRDIQENIGPLFGHEFVGEVVYAGENTGFKIGQRVTFNPNIAAERTTGFAEYCIAKGKKIKEALHIIPDRLLTEIAVFSEPFSCAIRSIEKLLFYMILNDFSDKKVAVIGAGNSGMYHIWLAQRIGAEITVFNIPDGRLNFVKERGLFDGPLIIFNESEEVWEELTGYENEYDVVVVAVTHITPKTLRLSSRLVIDGGYIHIYAGTRKGDGFCKIDIDSVRRNESKAEINIEAKRAFVTGTYGAQTDNFQTAFILLQEPELADRMQRTVSTIISLKELPKFIMDMAKGTKDPLGKVVVLPNAAPSNDNA